MARLPGRRRRVTGQFQLHSSTTAYAAASLSDFSHSQCLLFRCPSWASSWPGSSLAHWDTLRQTQLPCVCERKASCLSALRRRVCSLPLGTIARCLRVPSVRYVFTWRGQTECDSASNGGTHKTASRAQAGGVFAWQVMAERPWLLPSVRHTSLYTTTLPPGLSRLVALVSQHSTLCSARACLSF